MLDTTDQQARRWRTGAFGCDVYAMLDDDPSADDVLVGRMESQELASLVAYEHNTCLDMHLSPASW